MPAITLEGERSGWVEHFAKGFTSLGLLGFVKVFFAMGPWWNIRQGGLLGGGGGRNRRAGRQAGGRERLENISWTVIVIGVLTFLYVNDPSPHSPLSMLIHSRPYGDGYELGR